MSDPILKVKYYYSNGAVLFGYDTGVYIGFPECPVCKGTGMFTSTTLPYKTQCYTCQSRFSYYFETRRKCDEATNKILKFISDCEANHVIINNDKLVLHPLYVRMKELQAEVYGLEKPVIIKEEHYDPDGTIYKSIIHAKHATQEL